MGNELPVLNGAKLKKLRKERDMTQEEVAKAIGCTVKTYRSWEKGEKTPNSNYLIEIKNVFGVDCDFLLDQIEEKTHDLDFVCKYTGLSSDAITTLQICAVGGPRGYFDSFLRFCGIHGEMTSFVFRALSSQEKAIENGAFNDGAYHFAESLKKAFNLHSTGTVQLPDGAIPLNAADAAQFYIDCTTRYFREFLTEYVKETAENLKKGGVDNGEH